MHCQIGHCPAGEVGLELPAQQVAGGQNTAGRLGSGAVLPPPLSTRSSRVRSGGSVPAEAWTPSSPSRPSSYPPRGAQGISDPTPTRSPEGGIISVPCRNPHHSSGDPAASSLDTCVVLWSLDPILDTFISPTRCAQLACTGSQELTRPFSETLSWHGISGQ